MRKFRHIVLQRPMFAASAILVTAVGVASAATVIVLLLGLSRGPVPYASPGSILFISGAEAAPDGLTLPYWSRAKLLDAVSMFATGGAMLTSDQWSGRVAIAAVNPSFFRIFSSTAAQGRTFTTTDRGQAVVISYRLWRDGLRPGNSIRIGSAMYQVIGVMPAKFAIPTGTDLWEPMPPDENPQLGALPAAARSPERRDLGLVARCRASVTLAESEQELNAMFRRLQALEGNAGMATTAAGVEPLGFETLRDYLYGAAPPGLHLLISGAFLMLLCTVAAAVGLFLARYEERRAEISLRLFLGARPAAVIRLLLQESSALCLAGALAGLTAADYLLQWLRRGEIGSLPQLTNLSASTAVLAAALATAASILLLSALAAWVAVGPRRVLREGASGLTVGRTQRLFPRVLVATQVATATALACLGLILAASYLSASHTNAGFALSGTIAEPLPKLTHTAEMLRRLAAWQPNAAFALTSDAPLADPNGGAYEVSAPAEGSHYLARRRVVSLQYFSALRLPILAGHWGAEAGRVAISSGLARKLFGFQNPLGREVSVNRGPVLVVSAVVGDVRDRGVGLPPPPMLYAPLAEPLPPGLTLLAHFPDPRSASRALAELRSQTGGGSAFLISDLASRSLTRTASYLLLICLLASAALALAVAAAFALVWVHVARQWREIGIRAALGAGPRQIRLLVLRRGLALGSAAVPVGLAVGLVARARLAFQVAGLEAPALGPCIAAAGAVAASLLIAALDPACRAARLSPASALRRE